jgi:hypothetical protein
MSYINELDLLLEAEGPSRRDFNKSIAAAMTGGNLIPDMGVTGAANIASTGASVVSSSKEKLLAALNSYFINNSKNYAILAKVGGKKIDQVHAFLHAHPHMTREEAIVAEPLARYFYYEEASWADRYGPFSYTCLDDENVFGSGLEQIVFNNVHYPQDNPHYTTLTTVIGDDQDGRLFANSGDLIKHLASHFGGFKDFFKIFADCVAEFRDSASGKEGGSGDVSGDLLGFLLNAKEKAPLLYKSLGLKIDVEEYLRKKSQFWHKMQHDHSLKTAYEAKKIKYDFLSQLKEDGLLSDKLDKYIETHKNSAVKSKTKADEQDKISKHDRMSKHKKRTEHHLSTQRKEKKFDDEAIGRWEDEGGALGPLDEAIKRLLKNIL